MATQRPPGETPFHGLTRNHAIKCESLDNVKIERYVKSIAEITGPANIIAASKVHGSVIVFFNSATWVDTVCVEGVFINGFSTHIEPLVKPATKVIVSGVPPYIPAELLENELSQFGKVVSHLRPIPLGCKEDNLKHVKSFRRQLYMILDNDHMLDGMAINFVFDGRRHRVYLSTDEIQCFKCYRRGHIQRNCTYNPEDENVDNNTGHVPTDINVNNDQIDRNDEQSVNKDANTDKRNTTDATEQPPMNTGHVPTDVHVNNDQIDRNDEQSVNKDANTDDTDLPLTDPKPDNNNDVSQKSTNHTMQETPAIDNTKDQHNNDEGRVLTPPVQPLPPAPDPGSSAAQSGIADHGDSSSPAAVNTATSIAPTTSKDAIPPAIVEPNDDDDKIPDDESDSEMEDEIDDAASVMSGISVLSQVLDSDTNIITDKSITEFLQDTLHSRIFIQKCSDFCSDLKYLAKRLMKYRSTYRLNTSQKARIYKRVKQIRDYICSQ